MAVTASKVTIYRVNGKGRGWRSKPAAYRSAAISIINEKCDTMHDAGYHDRHGETCKYCSRLCDGGGRANGRRMRHTYDPCNGFDCAEGPTHSYRYRLVARLARWLRWRDERAVKGKT